MTDAGSNNEQVLCLQCFNCLFMYYYYHIFRQHDEGATLILFSITFTLKITEGTIARKEKTNCHIVNYLDAGPH